MKTSTNWTKSPNILFANHRTGTNRHQTKPVCNIKCPNTGQYLSVNLSKLVLITNPTYNLYQTENKALITNEPDQWIANHRISRHAQNTLIYIWAFFSLFCAKLLNAYKIINGCPKCKSSLWCPWQEETLKKNDLESDIKFIP